MGTKAVTIVENRVDLKGLNDSKVIEKKNNGLFNFFQK